MDSLITAAARALATGDLLGVLKRVGLRDDPPALALRGIAMAQLGDFERAKVLLRRAARAFGSREAVARARCVVAEAEIALVSRDLGWPARNARRGASNARGARRSCECRHARILEVRRLLLIGHLDEAEQALAGFDVASLPAALRANHELVVAGIAMRRLKTKTARTALARAGQAARDADIPALTAGGRKRLAGPEHARSASDRAGRGATPAARGGRSAAGVEGAGRRRLPPCRASARHGRLAGPASGAVRARARIGRGVACGCAERHAHRAGFPGTTRR